VFRLSEVEALIQSGLTDGPSSVLLEVLAPKAARGEVGANDKAESVDNATSSAASVVFDYRQGPCRFRRDALGCRF
jgi:hypothetical protein